jgi:hypothetical protein
VEESGLEAEPEASNVSIDTLMESTNSKEVEIEAGYQFQCLFGLTLPVLCLLSFTI